MKYPSILLLLYWEALPSLINSVFSTLHVSQIQNIETEIETDGEFRETRHENVRVFMAAVNTIITRMKDWLLAMLVVRVSDVSDPTLFHKILNDKIIPEYQETDEGLISLLNTIRQPKQRLQRKNLLKTLYEDTDS